MLLLLLVLSLYLTFWLNKHKCGKMTSCRGFKKNKRMSFKYMNVQCTYVVIWTTIEFWGPFYQTKKSCFWLVIFFIRRLNIFINLIVWPQMINFICIDKITRYFVFAITLYSFINISANLLLYILRNLSWISNIVWYIFFVNLLNILEYILEVGIYIFFFYYYTLEAENSFQELMVHDSPNRIIQIIIGAFVRVVVINL